MTRELYERPSIILHVSGLANKFGRAQSPRVCTEIDGVPVAKLVEQHGSPFFVFSEASIRKACRDAKRAFTVRYPKVEFAWSYKTNYLDAICKVFHSEGSWAEVVSEYEYEMARRLGVPGNRIIFNGPYKPGPALERAVADGARIHVDHFDELCNLEEVATRAGRPVDVALRLNMDTGIYPVWDRFGFNLDNGEATNAVRRLRAGGKLNLVGLHAHIGTFILEPNAYRNGATKLAAFAHQVSKDFGFSIQYIDVGGGFASRNTLHAQYAPGDETNPHLDDFAQAITTALLDANFPPESLPTLVLETGRALVDEAGTLVARVVGNKRLPNGVRSLIIDAGVNVLFTSFWYKHELLPAVERGGFVEETVVYGPLCMNIDVIRSSIRLPALDVGDPVVIRRVGAYNVTQWMQFIRMRPKVLMLGERGQVAVIRQEESVDDVKRLEKMPAWLG
jgi:diaminopimelate decarboxylase